MRYWDFKTRLSHSGIWQVDTCCISGLNVQSGGNKHVSAAELDGELDKASDNDVRVGSEPEQRKILQV